MDLTYFTVKIVLPTDLSTFYHTEYIWLCDFWIKKNYQRFHIGLYNIRIVKCRLLHLNYNYSLAVKNLFYGCLKPIPVPLVERDRAYQINRAISLKSTATDYLIVIQLS